MPESTLAAHPALACELDTFSVVCLEWRLRAAMADSSSGRLVIASRCLSVQLPDLGSRTTACGCPIGLVLAQETSEKRNTFRFCVLINIIRSNIDSSGGMTWCGEITVR